VKGRWSNDVGTKISKNDIVEIIAGEDVGKTGRVVKVFPRTNQLLVEGINYVKRHTRPTAQNQQGGILEKEAPVHVSNVRIWCPRCEKGVKMAPRVLSDGTKARVCRSCGEIIEQKR
jgi:large subunit ribosomal protein L24